MRSRAVAGAVLILLGLLNLAVVRTAVGGEIAPLIIGSAFLVWFAFSQSYGLLIPGAIMTGIGLGIVFDTMRPFGAEPVLIGLGSGFVAIYVIDRLMGNRRSGGWWPLIPGGIILLVSFEEILYRSLLRDWWPLGLVLLGLILIAKGPRGSSRQESPAARDNNHS